MIPTWVRDPKNDDLYINDLRKHVKGGIIVPPPGFNPLTVAAAPAAGIPTFGPPVVIEGAQDGCRQIFSLIGAFDVAVLADPQARFTVQIVDQAYRRSYMNRPVPATHVFGTPGNPFFLAKEIWLENQQVLLLDFRNNSIVGPVVYRMAMEARTFQAQSLSSKNVTDLIGKERKKALFFNPYWFASDNAIIIPAGGVTTVFFTNTRDYYLMLRYIMCGAISTGIAGDLQEMFTVRLFDATNSRPLMNQPVTLTAIQGNASFPCVLPQPWAIEPSTQIRADFQNLITDQPTEVFMTFHGVGDYVASQNPFDRQNVAVPRMSAASYGAA